MPEADIRDDKHFHEGIPAPGYLGLATLGRNIFQSHAPAAMIRAVAAVVHEDAHPDAAFALFAALSREVAVA